MYTKIVLVALTLASIGALVTSSGIMKRVNYGSPLWQVKNQAQENRIMKRVNYGSPLWQVKNQAQENRVMKRVNYGSPLWQVKNQAQENRVKKRVNHGSPLALRQVKSQAQENSVQFLDIPKLAIANETKLLDLLLRLASTDCKVSLPKTADLICKRKRFLELQIKKMTWTLTESAFGFMVLDTTPQQHVLRTFLDPFSRFNMEGYLQTVLTNRLSYPFYNFLFDGGSEKTRDQNYNIVSTFFAMTSKFGGQYTLRPSQYEAFVDDKDKWISDKYFTQQRLAGVNPMSLRRVTNSSNASIGLDFKKLEELLNPTFNWTAAVQRALGHDYSLKKAIDQGRLYVLRYEFMDNLPRERDLPDTDPPRQMWKTYSPIALFASAQDANNQGNHLVPVAIQMDFKPVSPVYTPKDGDNWMLAKLNLQVTDLGYAQIIEHLAKVHLMMEPFCVILKRALASEHPLHQILKYHCRDILTPNVVGTPVLLDEGKFVDQLFAFGNSGSAQILDNGYEFVTWEVTDFRGEIKKRGLDDKELLPYFPYRDDGEQILQVIENVVKEYVDLYYQTNETVAKDHELQDYLNELSAKGQLRYGGRYGSHYGMIKGLPARISTKQELCDIVTRIISQLTIQHAAVNYPLSDYAEYTPNLPTKLYNGTSVKSHLPNKRTSSIQASFSNTLASYRFDTLFDYGNDLKDIRAVEILNRYFSHLMTVVQPKMQMKNQQRKEDGDLTYPYFIPRWLPNGVQT